MTKVRFFNQETKHNNYKQIENAKATCTEHQNQQNMNTVKQQNMSAFGNKRVIAYI